MPKLRFIFTVILVAFLLFISASLGHTAATRVNDVDPLEVIERHNRRALTDIQDYDYGGSNAKHDPRRKPGIGH